MANQDIDLNEILLDGAASAVGPSTESADSGYDFREQLEPFPSGMAGKYPGYPNLEYAGGAEPIMLTANEEEALALELMSVSNDQELEEFLGGLLNRVTGAVRKIGKRVLPTVGRFIQGPGRKLLGSALPMIGTAVGTALAPGVGTSLGGALGGALGSVVGGGGGSAGAGPAASMFAGLPGGANGIGAALGGITGGQGPGALLSGLQGVQNPLAALLGSGAAGNLLGALLGGEAADGTLDEARLDFAKRMVRTVAQAVGNAALDPRGATDPRGVVKAAFAQAVQSNIPSALRPILAGKTNGTSSGDAGRWIRRGREIVLLGV
jgi:hypothetical protein